jgi:hypothetical protein
MRKRPVSVCSGFAGVSGGGGSSTGGGGVGAGSGSSLISTGGAGANSGSGGGWRRAHAAIETIRPNTSNFFSTAPSSC